MKKILALLILLVSSQASASPGLLYSIIQRSNAAAEIFFVESAAGKALVKRVLGREITVWNRAEARQLIAAFRKPGRERLVTELDQRIYETFSEAELVNRFGVRDPHSIAEAAFLRQIAETNLVSGGADDLIWLGKPSLISFGTYADTVREFTVLQASIENAYKSVEDLRKAMLQLNEADFSQEVSQQLVRSRTETYLGQVRKVSEVLSQLGLAAGPGSPLSLADQLSVRQLLGRARANLRGVTPNGRVASLPLELVAEMNRVPLETARELSQLTSQLPALNDLRIQFLQVSAR